MVFKDKLSKIIQNDFFLALILLVIFLLTNGYTYGWDDQHLEIPLLKKLIDPSLYAGDYYVESLKQNFTSFLYPILARIITIEQIPPVYFALYLLSRYFMFFWIYKLWHWISKNKLTAFSCVVMIVVLGRVEEFLYRTFSHQEFALAFIMAGMYFFYKERYFLAAAILGIAANFHALYSLFPLLYMLSYILFYQRTGKWKKLILSSSAFLLCALPLFIWVIKKHLNTPASPQEANLVTEWISLYKIACPQNFILYDKSWKELLGSLDIFFRTTRQYWVLIAFWILNLAHNQKFQEDKKSQTIMTTGFCLLFFSFIFSHIFPARFVLDLNLVRNAQFMLFILMGHTLILLFDVSQKERWWVLLLISISLIFVRSKNYIAFVGFFILFLLNFSELLRRDKNLKRNLYLTFTFLWLLFMLLTMSKLFFKEGIPHRTSSVTLAIISGLILCNYILHFFIKNPEKQSVLRQIFIVIPLVSFFAYFTYYHFAFLKIEKHGKGFWQLQRNWIDMQKYVKENTPLDALILVPHNMEMGGFRIFSERKILMSYRDCGIIGFDYKAAQEWQNRLNDIEPYQVFVRDPIESALSKAILKYRVNYIVFMRYLNPKDNRLMQLVYENDVFSLYKVLVNPLSSKTEIH